jgi:acyl-CoA thioester hydrolase
MNKTLTSVTEVPVKFSDVDSMQIAWHGIYVRYFEDARESFGKQYGIGYLDVFSHGFMIPIVHIDCDYKSPLKYGDTAIIEATFKDSDAAKICFEYKVYSKSDNRLVAIGNSVQVFMDTNYELYLTIPQFLIEWKEKYLK